MKLGSREAVSLLAVLALALLPAACGPESNRPLVRVGDQIIGEADLRRQLLLREGPRLLLEMIDTRLIMAAAEKGGVAVSDGELNLKYEQAVARVGSERDLEEKLKSDRRTKEEFRQQLRAETILDRLAQQRMQLTDEHLREYYQKHLAEFSHGEQVRVRLMLFASRANAEAVAQALRDPNADFAGLAKAFSEDPGTKDKGGDTGFFERSDYAKPISEVAFRLEPGQVSGVFAVPDGFAILKVEERRPAGAKPFAQLRDTLRARVQLKRLEQARQDWLNEARSQAKIVIPDEQLAARVRRLIEAGTPYNPTNLVPQIPTAPR